MVALVVVICRPHPGSRSNATVLYSMQEARALTGSIIYGLSDGEVFYIGKTVNAAKRFYVQRYTKNLYIRKRVNAAGDNLRVVVIAHNPTDLDQAERDAIYLHSATLLNVENNVWPKCRQCLTRPVFRNREKLCSKCAML